MEHMTAVMRKRPGMYVGDTGALGLFHLHEFILANLIEASSKPTFVQLRREGTTMHVTSDALFDGARAIELLDSGLISGHIDWEWALLCVSALSSRFTFDHVSDAGWFSWSGRQGVRDARGLSTRPAQFGTFVSFTPDPTIFATVQRVPEPRFTARCFELAHLCPGLRVDFEDADGGSFRVTRPRGLAELLESEGCSVQHDVSVTWQGVSARMVVGSRGSGGPTLHSFANRVRTRGGSHVQAMQDVMAQLPEISGDRSGVIAVEMERTELRFEGPTREVLRIDGLRKGLAAALIAAMTGQ